MTHAQRTRIAVAFGTIVRRAIVADETLSTSAHDVKRVARGGGATLRGPVANPAENEKLEQIAAEFPA